MATNKTESPTKKDSSPSRARLTLAANAPASVVDIDNKAEATENTAKRTEAKTETRAVPSEASTAQSSEKRATEKKARTAKRPSARATVKRPTAPRASQPKKEARRAAPAARGKTATRTKQTAAKAATGTTRRAAENVLHLGTRNVREAMNRGAGEAQRMKKQADRFTREGADQLSRVSNVASRTMNDSVAMLQGNMESYVECGNIAADLTRKVREEAFTFANDIFSSNVEISKDIFACRTINDLFDLQNRLIRTNLDSLFTQSTRMSEIMFDYMNQAAEPISDRISEATNRFSRNIAA